MMVDEFKLLRETIMKIIILDLLGNFWMLLTSIAIYILLGVLLAGVFKHFLPDSFIRRHMGGEGFIANIKAAIIGIPLPLCSCSIIPFISALKKSGASKSAIQTFLISFHSPLLGYAITPLSNSPLFEAASLSENRPSLECRRL